MWQNLPDVLYETVIDYIIGDEVGTLVDLKTESFRDLHSLCFTSCTLFSNYYFVTLCEATTTIYEVVSRYTVARKLRVRWGLRAATKFFRKYQE